ncbi:MAG: ATPase, T2SS/T4P/T4SS family [Candidatus Omnitrophota bacterium]|jgi:type II secretory ATPase GspE/PulE/Tfp pilus assembly ATPase PilB-like protein
MANKNDILLSKALMEKGILSSKDLEPFIKQADTLQEELRDLLIKSGVVNEKDILAALADKLKLRFIDIKDMSVDKSVLDKVPLKVAAYYRFIPIEIKERVLVIAASTPLDIKIQDEIRTQLGIDIELTLALSCDILEALKKYYGFATETLDKITSQQPLTCSAELRDSNVEDIEKLAGDASVIRLVNQIILEGWKKRATDIHIEPYRNGVNLRYRIDGLLYDANIPGEIKNFLNAIISRIKIMSNLNIVERRLPQDGRAIVKVQEQVLDLRISTIPTPFGESVVIRILPTQMLFSLEKLGLAKRDLKIFETFIQKPHGIIFVTGPTGSGKTTTLYASLNRINTKERKIITIEDPIEYEMNGIIQIQVQPEIGLDFARGLRSILRHDPDVIMVGEVRDLETAEIAIRVALTGHLIFSTLHTNDAPSGIARLLDIGVEPYLLASSVEAFLAQRLIRLICPECKNEDKGAPLELKELIARDLGLKSTGDVKVYRGKGCPACNFTGFFGRTAIYEMLPVDDAIKDLILKKSPSSQIKKSSIARGMRTLRQDGWQKVVSGLTTPEEVMKVTPVEEGIDSPEVKGLFTSAGLPEDNAPVKNDELHGSDKRAYKRLNDKVNISYKILEKDNALLKRGLAAEHLSVTKNISAGGVLFFLDEPIAVGSILDLKLELPDAAEPIECLVRVVRSDMLGDKNYDIAVCFLSLSGSERARLDRYVENYGEV